MHITFITLLLFQNVYCLRTSLYKSYCVCLRPSTATTKRFQCISALSSETCW